MGQGQPGTEQVNYTILAELREGRQWNCRDRETQTDPTRKAALPHRRCLDIRDGGGVVFTQGHISAVLFHPATEPRVSAICWLLRDHGFWVLCGNISFASSP